MSKVQEHILSCDILVAGGGPSGVPCAIAAARQGQRVILIQNRSLLGGNASSEVRMHIVGADCNGNRTEELATEARESGLIEEIRLETSVRNPQRSAAMLDLIFYEKCKAEENLTLLLNTTVIGVEMQDGKIVCALAERQSTEDVFKIEAKLFIDCTGDGRLGYEAGADFRRGRESSQEFIESFASDEADNKTLGSTILFIAKRHARPMPFIAPSWVRKFTEEDLKLRPHAEPGLDRGLEYGYWWAEWGGQLDTIKDNEIIRDELLAVTLGVWDHIKNSGNHGAENWALDWFGFLPGKRESRRFIGLHTFSQEDIMQSRVFDDAIAFGGWPIDTHPPEGVDKPDEKPCNMRPVPHLYNIPLRCFISKNIPNLMFAGRNMSATHIAFASTRVMATCAVAGQGVGTAAAFAIKNNVMPAQLVDSPDYMKEIQQQLLRDDCYLVGIKNEDLTDRAISAVITASSEQDNGKAANIVSGQTRSVHGKAGAPPERSFPGTHRWMSQPGASLPAWLELKWNEEVSISKIQLTFDTGLHRLLTLSHCDSYSPTMVWGNAQPETVRDYTVEGLQKGEWKTMVSVTDNWQRLCRHQLTEPVTVSAIRINVYATNGLDHARICEVRVFE